MPPTTCNAPVIVLTALAVLTKRVYPVVEPMEIAVPAPAKLTVVAVVFIKLNVVAVVVKSPPLTARSPSIIALMPAVNTPSTFKLFLTVVIPVLELILVEVLAPNALTVVAVVLKRLNVTAVVVKSPPSILTSPSISKLFLILVVPEADASTNNVAAPNALTVVAAVLAIVKVAVDTVKLLPSILMFPSTSKLFLILVVPVEAPIVIVVAAPNTLTVVAVVFARLKVVELTFKSPPSILRSPPTHKLAPIPTPPTTCNAPLFVPTD